MYLCQLGKRLQNEQVVVSGAFFLEDCLYLSSGGGGAYVPPAKRAAMLAASGLESAELEHLKKQMKGLLNRSGMACLFNLCSFSHLF